MIYLPRLIYKNKESLIFLYQQIAKLYEEFIELKDSKSDNEILEETFDIMQVCMSIIDMYDYNAHVCTSRAHFKKLKHRNWLEDGYYTINYRKQLRPQKK